MTSRRSVRSILVALCVAAGLLAGPQAVGAGGVDEAQRKVDQMLAELEQLRDQMGQLDEDYSGALDRQAELTTEIAASQARVDQMSAELGGVELVLQQIALDRFTSGDSTALSPIFSDAATYSAAEQRNALGLVAIDVGGGDIDELQSMVDDLNDERASLEVKQQEAATLVATLEQKQAEWTELEQVYTQKYAQAQQELGDAQLEAAEEARAAAAAEKAAREAAARAPASTVAPTPRGGGGTGGNTGGGNTGGGNTGGGNTGGGNTGGGNTGGGSGGSNLPPPSGKAGIAIAAAYSQLGVPYRFAAESPGVAFDCSGLTKWAWGRAGVYLPHQSSAQYGTLPHIPKDQAQPGDLVFYYSPIGHVGIYIGGGQMIHAPQTGDVVKISTVHWNKVVGVGRPG
ncbi:MAG: NlpC/P60 family protein [Actinomycetota bacterium]|nr:NlpC/P60 family protein [Actinomycetota bacterium]